jgi:hypothetical protein
VPVTGCCDLLNIEYLLTATEVSASVPHKMSNF